MANLIKLWMLAKLLVVAVRTLVLDHGRELQLKAPIYCDAVVNAKKAHGV